MLLGWQNIEQDRDRQRTDRAARHTLDDTADDKLHRRRCMCRDYQAQEEDSDRNQIHRLSAIAAGEPTCHRHGQHACGDIGGEYPTDLVIRHRQRALDIQQGRIGQRDADRLHEARHQHRGDDDAAILGRRALCESGAHRAAFPWCQKPR